MGWSGVDYLWIIVMFLSAVWTLILTAPIHCRASIAETLMQRHISTNLMKKQTHPNLGWPEGEHIFGKFSFWVNYSFERQTWLVVSAPLTWNISGWLFWGCWCVSAVPCVCGWFGHCCHPDTPSAGLEQNCAPIWLISPERKSKSKTERWNRKNCSLLKTFWKIFTESISWMVVVTVYLLVIWCAGHWSWSPAHLAKGRGSGGCRDGAETSHVKLRRTLSNLTCHLIDKESTYNKINSL